MKMKVVFVQQTENWYDPMENSKLVAGRALARLMVFFWNELPWLNE
jgi:hypothetical protein